MPTPLRHRPRGRRAARLVACLFLIANVGCSLVEPDPQLTAPAEKTGIGVPRNWISTPRLFSNQLEVVALAATPSRLLASTRGPAPTKVVALAEDGSARAFAPGFVAPPDAVCPLEVTPGIGDFPQDQVLVGLGDEVWLLAAVGPPARFATVPEENAEITGLAFDTVGGFENELLALTLSGAVYRIDPFGSVRYVGTFGPGANGPSVAASGFGTHAGRLLVAFPKVSEVRAMDPAGNVSLVLQWSGVSGVRSLPDVPRAFGSTGAALFVAASTGAVYRYPLADVASRGGQLLLSSMHRSGSGIAVAEQGGYRTLPFSRSMGPEICASFVRRPMVTPITIEIFPGVVSKVLVATSTVPVPVALFATAWFSPASLLGGEVSLAGALPATKIRTTGDSYTDLNGDGRLDLVLQFRPSDMQLPLGDATLVLEGMSLEEERVRGTEDVLVQ